MEEYPTWCSHEAYQSSEETSYQPYAFEDEPTYIECDNCPNRLNGDGSLCSTIGEPQNGCWLPEEKTKEIKCPDECFNQEGHGYNCTSFKCNLHPANEPLCPTCLFRETCAQRKGEDKTLCFSYKLEPKEKNQV